MKKVLVIVSRYSRDKDDPGDFVTDLSLMINNKGYEVIVLAPHDYNLKFTELLDGIKVYRFPYFFPLKYQKVAYGPGILDNLKKSFLAKIQVPFFCLSELLYTIKIIKQGKIDIIHSHWLIPQGIAGAICKKVFRIPHITTVHGSDINLIRKNKILKKICLFISNNSDRITVNSSHTKKSMLTIGGAIVEEKIEIIPMGVDLNRFQVHENKNLKQHFNAEHLVLFVGRLIDWKGADYLIVAMADVVKHLNAKLLIIGDGPEKTKLKELAERLGLKDKVVFIGQIDNSEVPLYYTASDIFVIPSIVVEGHTEGLGVVTLEAMACGTPAIGSNVGGIPDVIKDEYNGFLVAEKSPEELAQKIIKLLSDRKLAADFKKNGLRTVQEKFSWDVVSDRFINIFQRN